MITGGEATLKSVLTGLGHDPDSPRLRWMVLTWDLAKIEGTSNKFYRFHLTQDALLTTYGKRAPAAFTFRGSRPMQIGTLTSTSGDPLARAVRTTAEKLKEGYVLVCRPLAVDCSVFAGPDVTEPRDLLGEVTRKTKAGTGVLDTVNQARSDARATHISADVSWGYAGLAPDDLWFGR